MTRTTRHRRIHRNRFDCVVLLVAAIYLLHQEQRKRVGVLAFVPPNSFSNSLCRSESRPTTTSTCTGSRPISTIVTPPSSFSTLPSYSLCPSKPATCRSTSITRDIITCTNSVRSSGNSPEPMASIDALDRLVPRSQIRDLSQAKSNTKGFLQVGFHFALVLLANFLPVPFPPVLSLLITAFVSSFYFNGMHETIHRTAFASNILNDVFAHLFGFLCFRPARHYYYYHWQHHRYTGNPELDSELQSGFLDFPVTNVWGYLLYLSGLPFWLDAISTTVKHACGVCPESYLTNERARREVTTEARIYLALYALIGTLAVASGQSSIRLPILRLWVLPSLLGQPFLRFYLLAEHRGRKNSPIIYENTRSIIGTNGLYRQLAWQMPYHIEHHAWPTVPFHKLARAHELLASAAAATATSSSSGQHLFDSGEMHLDLYQSWKGGYVGFNFRFLRHLYLYRSKAKR